MSANSSSIATRHLRQTPWEESLERFYAARPERKRTPLVSFPTLRDFPEVKLWAKLEGHNLTGSSKDRPAYNILWHGIQSGKLHQNSVIVESSSGNMAIALAKYARELLDLRVCCVTDNRSLPYNRKVLEDAGVELHVLNVDGASNPVQQRVNAVEEIVHGDPNAFWTQQYRSIYNPESYAPLVTELCEQAPHFDMIFVPVSTGGAAAGIHAALQNRPWPEDERHQNPHTGKVKPTRLAMVDAKGSEATHLEKSAPRGIIVGLGSSCGSNFLSLEDYDDNNFVILVEEAKSVAACYETYARWDQRIGGSSGAVVAACHAHLSDERYARDPQSRPREVVLFFADQGDRYRDTIYSPEWLAGRHLTSIPRLNLF